MLNNSMKTMRTTVISNAPAWKGFMSIYGDDWSFAQQMLWSIGRTHISVMADIPPKSRSLLESIGAIESYHRTWNPSCSYVRLTARGRVLFRFLYSDDKLVALHSTGSMNDYRCPA